MLSGAAVEDWLIVQVADLAGLDQDDVACDVPFAELGLSSLQAVEVSDRLERFTGLALAATIAFDHPTIRAAADHVAAERGRRGAVMDGRPRRVEAER